MLSPTARGESRHSGIDTGGPHVLHWRAWRWAGCATTGRSNRCGSRRRICRRARGHPFYERLNRILEAAGFDAFVEGLCAPFYAVMGRPSPAPGRYFRLLLIGYFEGLDSERGIAWRAEDSLSMRAFLRLAAPAAPPDHSTISRTRRLFPVETHQAVFTWVLEQLAASGLVAGKTLGVDATTLEANAAMRSIVRRDTGGDYTAFLTRLAKASASRRRRRRSWRVLTGSGRRRRRTRIGRTPTTRTRKSRR